MFKAYLKLAHFQYDVMHTGSITCLKLKMYVDVVVNRGDGKWRGFQRDIAQVDDVGLATSRCR